MRKFIAIIGVIGSIVFLQLNLFAQQKKQGKPIVLKLNKEVGDELVWYSTPKFNKEDFIFTNNNQETRLKPFKFAHSFDVKLNKNSIGKWSQQNEYNIWKLGIESHGAYSIYLIFDQYKLPKGAKLFLYNEAQTEMLGAFTSENNKQSGLFSTLPISGDRIIIHYEEPVNSAFVGELQIAKIGHDFVGLKSVLANEEHRPLGLSGDCNIDVNCESYYNYRNTKNSVCRLIIDDEVCSGVLLNTTANDGRPFVITAGHCIENDFQSQVALFLFNYESPYCGSIDGDITHSIEGSSIKARYDSLDFCLVELSTPPPNYYRPHYAGWNIEKTAPSSTFTIHHPLGDIKKIAIDENSPVISTYNGDFIASSFWKIGRWEKGVTEGGSSGGPLFSNNHKVIGTLTGGAATCVNPVSDYFEMFYKSWDYSSDTLKQLKYWLDPNNTGEKSIEGYTPYSGVNLCKAYTHFGITDTTQLVHVSDTKSDGYWSGTNNNGITEFAEKYSNLNSCQISGLSMGVAKCRLLSVDKNASIKVNVYEGGEVPQLLLYTQDFLVSDITKEAMNYLTFNEPVSTTGNFFISYTLENISAVDTFAVYQAKRETADNTFFVKDDSGWMTYKSATGGAVGSSLLFEIVACDVDEANSILPSLHAISQNLKIYPNPVSWGSTINISSSDLIQKQDGIRIFDILGKQADFKINSSDDYHLNIQLSNAKPGIYFVAFNQDNKNITGKFTIVP